MSSSSSSSSSFLSVIPFFDRLALLSVPGMWALAMYCEAVTVISPTMYLITAMFGNAKPIWAIAVAKYALVPCICMLQSRLTLKLIDYTIKHNSLIAAAYKFTMDTIELAKKVTAIEDVSFVTNKETDTADKSIVAHVDTPDQALLKSHVDTFIANIPSWWDVGASCLIVVGAIVATRTLHNAAIDYAVPLIKKYLTG